MFPDGGVLHLYVLVICFKQPCCYVGGWSVENTLPQKVTFNKSGAFALWFVLFTFAFFVPVFQELFTGCISREVGVPEILFEQMSL